MILNVLVSGYIVPFLSDIIASLREANFIFVTVKRQDTEAQLVSLLLAHTTQKWKSLRAESPPALSAKVLITDFSNAPGFLQDKAMFDSRLAAIGITCPIIYYETVFNDISSFLGIPREKLSTNTHLQRQRTENPYDRTENADEVRSYITKLLNV